MIALLLATLGLLATSSEEPPEGAVLGWLRAGSLESRELGALVGLESGWFLAGGVWSDRPEPSAEILEWTEGGWKDAGTLPGGRCRQGVAGDAEQAFLVGGEGLDGAVRDVLVLRATEAGLQVGSEWRDPAGTRYPLPPLPAAAAGPACAATAQQLFVLGGAEGRRVLDRAWHLELGAASPQWSPLPWPPAPARAAAACTVQDDGRGPRLYLFGGIGPDRRILDDVHSLSPRELDWRAQRPMPLPLRSPWARALGTHHILVVGSVGEGSRALVYHTVTDTWTDHGPLPWAGAASVAGRGEELLALGRDPAGLGAGWVGAEVGLRAGFSLADYAVVGLYLAALVLLGLWCSRRHASTEQFFLGGRRIPWWAAGLSIFGTQLSAITFMAIPAVAYRTDWVYFLGNMTIVIAAPIVVFAYLPHFRRAGLTSAYEFLERRFGLAPRLVGSGAFLLFQLGRMGIVLYLPALALATVTGTEVHHCILVMGVLATLYTVLGGIEAVIWTDVLQVGVLLGGAVVSVLVIGGQVEGGLDGLIAVASEHDKFRWSQPGFDLATTTLGVVLLGRLFDSLTSYTSDQAVVQRYLTTAGEGAARRSIWTNAVLTVPASMVFFGLGTALWVFYRQHPERLHPQVGNDDVLPYFIAHELPTGLAGLVIAGLFAASMSSLDSSMNSMATALSTDFHRRLRPGSDDGQRLRTARVWTLVFGALGTGSALTMAALQSRSMLDQYAKVVGLFGGGLAGLFATGVFLGRRSSSAALLGFFGSALILYLVKTRSSAHFFLYAGVGMLSCMAITFLADRLLPRAPGSEAEARPLRDPSS